jgi:hypothetical protein
VTPEQREIWLAGRTKHGAYAGGGETSEHAIWRGILARCGNPRSKDYGRYGALGVRVAPEWVGENGFCAFLASVGPRPSLEHQIDRIAPNGNYDPDNCRWATRSEQQKNKRSTRRYTDGAFTGVLVEVAEYLGRSKELLHWRWKNWNTFERGQLWRELQNQ